MFDMGQLLGPLIFSQNRFKELWELLEDHEALSVHFGKKRMHAYDDEGWREEPLREDHIFGLRENINEARQHYANMMLVNAFTYLEDITFSFFTAVFEKQPLGLNEQLKDDGREATIPLRTLLLHGKEDILSQLISEGSKRASNGDLSVVFKRVKKLTGYQVPKQVEESSITLQKTRNRIVHEAAQLSVGYSQVIAAFEIVTQVLQHLGHAAVKAGVQVYDPAGCLGD